MKKEDEEDKELLNLITEPTYFKNDDDNNESLELSLQKYKDNNKISNEEPLFNLLAENNNKLLLPKISSGKMKTIEKKINMNYNENEGIKINKYLKGINRGNNIRYIVFNQLLNNNIKDNKLNFKSTNINNENNKRYNFVSIEKLPYIK